MSRRFFPKIRLPQSLRVSTGHQVPLSKTLAPGSDRLFQLRIWPHGLDFCQGWKAGAGAAKGGWKVRKDQPSAGEFKAEIPPEESQ